MHTFDRQTDGKTDIFLIAIVRAGIQSSNINHITIMRHITFTLLNAINQRHTESNFKAGTATTVGN